MVAIRIELPDELRDVLELRASLQRRTVEAVALDAIQVSTTQADGDAHMRRIICEHDRQIAAGIKYPSGAGPLWLEVCHDGGPMGVVAARPAGWDIAPEFEALNLSA